ncbi:hypothetical protein Zm00014a_034081 [Zea mays]|uniref:Uncharacterized protein n=1 Tax=Zea mays TaxID=4577 RepID=A0A3L6DQD9_MAIZE|nr:hypothetical protein Zm00014a_034081 [Zea mays]
MLSISCLFLTTF